MSDFRRQHGLPITAALSVLICLARLNAQSNTPSAVDQWTDQLGSNDFFSRRTAYQQLLQNGDATADTLFAARRQQTGDRRMVIERLLGKLDCALCSDSDSPQVVQWLGGYGERTFHDRRLMIDYLATQSSEESGMALARIARLEKNDALATRTAISLIERLGATGIDSGNGASDEPDDKARQSIRWLRICLFNAEPSIDPRLANFELLARNELDAIGTGDVDETQQENCRRLVEWLIDRELAVNRQASAKNWATMLMDLIDDTPDEVSRMLLWLRSRELSAAAADFYRRYSATIESTPLTCYQMADLFEFAQQPRYATRLVDLADVLAAEAKTPRYAFGLQLQRLGLYRYAEIEFRRQLTTSPVDSMESLRARMLLLDLLVDQMRYLDAATLIDQIGPLLEADGWRDKVLSVARRSAPSLLAYAEYCRALDAQQRNDKLRQRIHLLRSVELDPYNSDILIGLYSTSDKDPHKVELAEVLIVRALARIDDQIKAAVQRMSPELEPAVRHSFEFELAVLLNRWAWLAANTDRYLGPALVRAKEAVELRPGYAPFADTLARCLYANGQLDESVAAAQQAVAAAPHTLEFRRNLEHYRHQQKSQSVAGLLNSPNN